MAGSPGEASSPEEAGSPEERTILYSCRSSNASSSSSSSSDDDEAAEPTEDAVGELDGGAPPEEPTVHATSSAIDSAQEHQQRQHKESDAEEAGKPSLGSGLMSMVMVAGGVAVAIAAAFVVNEKR